METKPLTCTFKQQHHIRLGGAKVDFHSGCDVLDVSFPNVFYVEIQEIHLKNYYTASVSVIVKQKDAEEGEPKWKVAVRNFELMPSPHCDPGGEDYFTISQKQMLFPLVNILGLRFILRQPSPVWREFKIEDIKIYKTPYQSAAEGGLPAWLSDSIARDRDEDYDQQLKTHGVPSVNSLSRDLQSMWALMEQTGMNQTRSSLGRYDVEGSYEINLLSYT